MIILHGLDALDIFSMGQNFESSTYCVQDNLKN